MESSSDQDIAVQDQSDQIAVNVPVTPGTLHASNEYVEIFHQDALELDGHHENAMKDALVDTVKMPMSMPATDGMVKMMNGGPYNHNHHDDHHHHNNRLPMRSRESIDANHHLTDINYENNHSL